MSLDLKVGDAVTYYDVLSRLLVHCRIDSFFESDNNHGPYMCLVRLGVAGRQPYTSVPILDEGDSWCKGHVSENDPVGRALLTAAALKYAKREPVIDANDGHELTDEELKSLLWYQ